MVSAQEAMIFPSSSLLYACHEIRIDVPYLEESETMTVAAALDAATIFRSEGTNGDPCHISGIRHH